MTAYGEYAMHIGSAAAMTADDTVFGQYREQGSTGICVVRSRVVFLLIVALFALASVFTGVLYWRGFTLDDFCNQCFNNHAESGLGRQMPVHYGSRKLNFHTISSPLTTQLPQAVGAAYANKLKGKDAITMVYFGEGAASEVRRTP